MTQRDQRRSTEHPFGRAGKTVAWLAPLVVALGCHTSALAHHPAAAAASASGTSMASMGALGGWKLAPFRLSLAYRLSLQSAQAPSPSATVLTPFGRVTQHVLALGSDYWFGPWWCVQAVLPFGVSVRSQTGLSQRSVWGLGDLRLGAGRRFMLAKEARRSQRTVQLYVRAGLTLPTGRYREKDFVEASYMEPDTNTGALAVRRVRAQTALGGGVFAGVLGVTLGQRWHRNSRWLAMAQASLPFASTREGQTLGNVLAARALFQLMDGSARFSAFLGPDLAYHGKDRWAPEGPDALGLDREQSPRVRWGLAAGASMDIRPEFSCAIEGVVGLWQQAEAGALREHAQAMFSCRWALGEHGYAL